MKNIFKSNEDRMTEKAFSNSIIISVLSIFLCVIALCSMTYAWFTSSVRSENKITSSVFSLDIEVYDSNGNEIVVSPLGDGRFSCVLTSVGSYSVFMEMSDENTASKGYCDIEFSPILKKQTAPISKDASIGVDPFAFTIDADSDNMTIIFTPKWGISASAEIEHNPLLSK